MDDKFSQPPWYFREVSNHICAANGVAVATLLPGAPKAVPNPLTDLVTHRYPEVLAAAPSLLRALEGVKATLEQELGGPRHRRAEDAVRRTGFVTEYARAGNHDATPPSPHHWEINSALPPPEVEANSRVLGAAKELFDAAIEARAILSDHVDNDGVRALRAAVTRAYGGE